MAKSLKVTDVVVLSVFLGVSIQDHGSFLSQSQCAYANHIIELAGLTTAKKTTSPIPMGYVLYEARMRLLEKENYAMERTPYREIVGSLLYLATRTRIDIATAVSLLGKFNSSPAPQH